MDSLGQAEGLTSRRLDGRRVVIAMSGGVDSSVAAALLARRGADVVGVTLWLFDSRGRCCGDGASERAARAAAKLGIPHYVWDFRREFNEAVVTPFVQGYSDGRTPNPCLTCNRAVKFKVMLQRVLALGFDALATGHYARIAQREGRLALLRARDRKKDQSYALYAVDQGVLGHLELPLGELEKSEVRRLAARLGLPTAQAPESQDICFVKDQDVASFVASRSGAVGDALAGPVEDLDGRVLGTHGGIQGFTVGQRRGLGISDARRRYVIDIDPERRAVIVGGLDDLMVSELQLGDTTWVWDRPRGTVDVMTRYRGPCVPARVVGDGETARVLLGVPAPRPAPGQAVVCYDGDEVLGGGTAEGRARRSRCLHPSGGGPQRALGTRAEGVGSRC